MGFLALEECGYFPQFVQDCVEGKEHEENVCHLVIIGIIHEYS